MNDRRDTKRSNSDGKQRSVTSDLAARISRARGTPEPESGAGGSGSSRDMTGLSRGLRLGSEFIAAILVGTGIGYLLDLWLGTSPWLLLVMLMVGFAAGVMNITRTVREVNTATPPPPGSDIGFDDDEDDER